MLTQQEKKQIENSYFDGTLEVSQLTPAEYEYYYNEFAIATEINLDLSFLYFDFSGYAFVTGTVWNKYDRHNELIDGIYQIKEFRTYAVQDHIEQKILPYLENKQLYSNLRLNNALSAFLVSQGLILNPVAELTDFDQIAWLYINLCGKVEEQNSRIKLEEDRNKMSFFGSKNIDIFREESKKVDKINKAIPSSIMALLHWYKLTI